MSFVIKNHKRKILPITICALLLAALPLTISYADVGDENPPVVYIYDITGSLLEELTVFEDELFSMIGIATGDQPLTYSWLINGVEVHQGNFLQDYSISQSGAYLVILSVTDVNNLTGEDTVNLTVIPLPSSGGDICGSVEQLGGLPAAGVTVILLDIIGEPLGDPVVTNETGSFYFADLDQGLCSVMIVTPLGFSALPGETQTEIEPGDPCTEVSFELVPVVTTNECRSMGYWKHQFDSYLTGHGHAQETEVDLHAYLDEVFVHFDILGLFMGLDGYGFEEAAEILALKGRRTMESRARQQLFALLLNFASGRIGNATIISEDGRDAADAIAFVSDLIGDGVSANDELAKDICEDINHGMMVAADIIPLSYAVFKQNHGGIIPTSVMLQQNYPNPFNARTQVSFYLPESGHVTLEIFNIAGQRVATPVDKYLQAGYHRMYWDASDYASGVYLYRLTTDGGTAQKKMILLK